MGLLIPSAEGKLDHIVRLVAEEMGDNEFLEKLIQAQLLHIYFYRGDEIAGIDEETARKTTHESPRMDTRKEEQV